MPYSQNEEKIETWI